jgi:hypothetical protein
MSFATPDTLRVPVAVLVERAPATSPWAEWSWRVVEVLEDAPAVPDWTLLREEAGRSLFLAGWTEVALHPSDTPNYRENLAADPPRLFVVLRPGEAAPGMALLLATVDGGEAESFADSGADLLEAVAMPPRLRATLAAFVARHHVERSFHKRRRDRADPDALGTRPGRRGGEEER